MSRTLAVVVTYHPDEAVRENLKALLEQVNHVVVVDNESSDNSKSMISSFSMSQLTAIFNDSNNGVAKGFNQGLRWGMENGFDYFLLLDQDSRPSAGMASKLVVELDVLLSRGVLAIVGPQHEDFEQKVENFSSELVVSVPLLITSGCLLSKKVIEKIGLYDERLFIDHVDHDYCLRLFKNGGQVMKVTSAILLHRFGEARVKTFMGKTFFMQEYSPMRRYFMMRNRIVLYKRYGMFRGRWFWMDLRSGLADLAKLILFEKKKSEKLVSVFRGLWDGICWAEK